MKKIVYIHGLSSSGSSKSVGTLRRLLPTYKIIAPDLPINPMEALALLENLYRKEKPDLIIGSSMGGMFAQKLRGGKKLLINPAFHVSEFMRQNKGCQSFFYPRKDGIQSYEITDALCDAYERIEENQFEQIDDREKMNTHALFGLNDQVVNCREEYALHYPLFSLFNGEHGLTEDEFRNIVIPLAESMME